MISCIKGVPPSAGSGRENRSLWGPPVRHHSLAGCSGEHMTALDHNRGSPARKGAVRLALRYYGRQMARLGRFTVPAMLLPALGNTCIFYVAPLIVAQLVGRFAGHGLTGIDAAMPYVIGSQGCCFSPRSCGGSASTA